MYLNRKNIRKVAAVMKATNTREFSMAPASLSLFESDSCARTGEDVSF